MTTNDNLNRLMELEIIQQFMQKHRMQGMMCSGDFILYRYPYVISVTDFLIENYLPITLSDLTCNLLIQDSSILRCSLDMGFQNLEKLREKHFDKHPALDIFLSEQNEKMADIYTHIEAIDQLLPLIEVKGGLISMKDKSFDSRFDFSTFVRPMYLGLKASYLKYIDPFHTKAI